MREVGSQPEHWLPFFFGISVPLSFSECSAEWGNEFETFPGRFL
jgi:hypothetical protein